MLLLRKIPCYKYFIFALYIAMYFSNYLYNYYLIVLYLLKLRRYKFLLIKFLLKITPTCFIDHKIRNIVHISLLVIQIPDNKR